MGGSAKGRASRDGILPMMDSVQFLYVIVSYILLSIRPIIVAGEAILHDSQSCAAYRSNFANEKPTYYRWNGSTIRNCITDFSKRTSVRNHYICVEILSFEFVDCSADVEYYGINLTAPARTFNCHTKPNTPRWCCNTDAIQIKLNNNRSTTSNFFFRVFAITAGSVYDDCLPPTTTTTTTTTTDPFNAVVLTDIPACKANRVNMVGPQLKYFKWKGMWSNSCTVGFHKKPDIYSDSLTCIEILNIAIHDCSTRIRFYGLTTSGRPFKTLSCHTHIKPRWCCSVNTINIKFDVIQYTNDDELFFGVYKVPAGFVADECPDVQNLDDSPYINSSNTIQKSLLIMLGLLLIPLAALVFLHSDHQHLLPDF
ncbi:uncharacterized protein LOC132558597 [Ylistrum balloti]|uniref:uncharacterized protein LOC132558597 n=1 Tax=Ylistrum balloti TaxID=509963 RepID=UPI002905C147|nr:uncharacterized protein LOC132558597 [Ylistrum balloti]